MHRTFAVIALLLLAVPLSAKNVIDPIAPDLRSDHFVVSIDNQQSPVAHAATTYYFVNLTIWKRAKVNITANTDGYWDKGVDVQPWRWGIRPKVNGRTISFTITEPMKLSISRPGNHGAGAEMLFLFANAPEHDAPKKEQPGLRYYGPGTYHENLDARNGEFIYLAPGALVFGSLNVWGVHDVKVFGRGTIVYDGPQNPDSDEGWMHKPNWHVVVMDNARNIRIVGITLVVRSRTWMIQMLGSKGITFENVKVIGGCPGNANQDGMDWLGGGDTVVRDSFFRASDDIFALYGNWLGYDAQAIRTPGETVANIQIEDSVLSTSISNVVRVSWPEKVFDSHHFTLRNSDVIHMGMGGCKVPFALLEIWDDPNGKGEHTDYTFENIRLEDWYSLLQLRKQNPAIRNVWFKNIWALQNPSFVPSIISGEVRDIGLSNISIAGNGNGKEIPVDLAPGAAAPTYNHGTGPHAEFRINAEAGRVTFDASAANGEIRQYLWTFGDGTHAAGKKVRHTFPDAKGTEQNGSGVFRVLLHIVDKAGREDWLSRPFIVAETLLPAVTSSDVGREWHYRYFEGNHLTLAELPALTPIGAGEIATVGLAARRRNEGYAFVFDGFLHIPSDGGYLFQVFGNDAAELSIDGHLIARSPDPKVQVCGMVGNMVQMATGSIGMKAGAHAVHIAMTHNTGPDGFAIDWQSSGTALKGLTQ